MLIANQLKNDQHIENIKIKNKINKSDRFMIRMVAGISYGMMFRLRIRTMAWKRIKKTYVFTIQYLIRCCAVWLLISHHNVYCPVSTIHNRLLNYLYADVDVNSSRVWNWYEVVCFDWKTAWITQIDQTGIWHVLLISHIKYMRKWNLFFLFIAAFRDCNMRCNQNDSMHNLHVRNRHKSSVLI